MSVASRIFSILRSQARATSRVLFERARGGSPFAGSGDAPSADDNASASHGSWDGSQGDPGRGQGAGPHARRSGSAHQDPDLATYYANLEIPYGAGRDEVESAWKRQARRYHPDRFASDPERHTVATELLQGINHAYNEICRHLTSSEGA